MTKITAASTARAILLITKTFPGIEEQVYHLAQKVQISEEEAADLISQFHYAVPIAQDLLDNGMTIFNTKDEISQKVYHFSEAVIEATISKLTKETKVAPKQYQAKMSKNGGWPLQRRRHSASPRQPPRKSAKRSRSWKP